MEMIFCVEDDNGIRDLMIYALNSADFEAKGFSSGAELFAALKENTPQLIMLDIMLPDMDGIEILKRIRGNSATAEIPVIMATAKGTEFDKVTGLDFGADDYLAKPFGMMEMISRVKAVLRRTSKNAPVHLTVGALEMNLDAHTVTAAGKPAPLTLKEFELLRLFIENIGQAFSRERLLQSVWGSDFVGETRTVDVHIGTLRTKLGECGGYIETVRGVGYRMRDKL